MAHTYDVLIHQRHYIKLKHRHITKPCQQYDIILLYEDFTRGII